MPLLTKIKENKKFRGLRVKGHRDNNRRPSRRSNTLKKVTLIEELGS